MRKKKETRFVRVYMDSTLGGTNEILVDKETGVNYLYHSAGYSGGLTPLLNSDGTPVVTPVLPKEE